MSTSDVLLPCVACVYLGVGLVLLRQRRISPSEVLFWPLLWQRSIAEDTPAAPLPPTTQRLAVLLRRWPTAFAGHDHLVHTLRSLEEKHAKLGRELHGRPSAPADQALMRLFALEAHWSNTLRQIDQRLGELENCVALMSYEPEWASSKTEQLFTQISNAVEMELPSVSNGP